MIGDIYNRPRKLDIKKIEQKINQIFPILMILLALIENMEDIEFYILWIGRYITALLFLLRKQLENLLEKKKIRYKKIKIDRSRKKSFYYRKK